MNHHRLHGAAITFLLLLCALGISIAVQRAQRHDRRAADTRPAPVDMVGIDPAGTAYDTQALWNEVRAGNGRYAGAGGASRPAH